MVRISLVLPCYNEAARLPDTLHAQLAALPPDPGLAEIIVVDDGSTDATRAVAEAAAAADPRVRLLVGGRNRGKGSAVRAGMRAARGQLVVFTDADGSYSAAQVRRVLAALDDAPVAIGARDPKRSMASPIRRTASRVFNAAMRRLVGLPYHDTQCGLKGFRREAARDIFGRARVDRFAFDAEILLLARALGYRVVEVEVVATERPGSKVRLAADALSMLRDAWRLRREVASGRYE